MAVSTQQLSRKLGITAIGFLCLAVGGLSLWTPGPAQTPHVPPGVQESLNPSPDLIVGFSQKGICLIEGQNQWLIPWTDVFDGYQKVVSLQKQKSQSHPKGSLEI